VQVTIDGVPRQMQYAGSAPGFAGLSQINVLVPAVTGRSGQDLDEQHAFSQAVHLWIQ
jgi:uncharacterized protein (TIGR03437 family)